jgi:uncharacterized membrane protein YheB (UPF0754 family)
LSRDLFWFLKPLEVYVVLCPYVAKLGVQMTARKPNDVIQLSKIRMREQLRKTLAREAEKNNRTLTAEIVERLAESLSRDEVAEMGRAMAHGLASGDRVNTELLLQIVYELRQTKSGWSLTKETTDKMADSLANIVRRVAVAMMIGNRPT